jgi:uncharacterized membrane protein
MAGEATIDSARPRQGADGTQRVARALRRHSPLGVLLAFFGVVYALLSVLRHDNFETGGWDLGIFDQAIWHWSRFEWPASTVRGFDNLLGDHFHPILVLAAPVYWVWDDARALLLLQVALFLLSAVPVAIMARKRFGQAASLLWTAGYLLFWGVQGAIQFDFHEIAFAVPLISFGLWLTYERRWLPAACCVLALLLVKENLSFLVVAWGVVFVLSRQWRLGAAVVAAGAAWFLVITKVVMPELSGGAGFAYWSYTQFGPDAVGAAKTVVTKPWMLVTVAVTPAIKLKTMFLLVAPFAFLTLLSWPAVLLVLTLVAERMLSTNHWYWASDSHYSATIAPVLAIGALDGLARLRRRYDVLDRRRGTIAAIAAAVLLLNIGVTAVAGKAPLRRLTDGAFWHVTADERDGHALIAWLPDDASVTTQSMLVPHISHRQEIYELQPGLPLTDLLIVNPTRPHIGNDEQYQATIRGYRDRGYREVWRRGNWLALSRDQTRWKRSP